ncbi:hypothetical protein COEREDRAFT_12580, partial [Coemansia reversa NRRL 1564]
MSKANKGKRTRSRRNLGSYREATSSQPSYFSGDTSGSEYCPSSSQRQGEGSKRQRRRGSLSSVPEYLFDNTESAGQASELSDPSEPTEEVHASAFPLGISHTTPPYNQELAERVLSQVQRSPSKVTGNKYSIGGDFWDIKGSDAITVDKTLLCKAFHDLESQTTALYLPRRFGKTFSLSMIQSFFCIPVIEDVPISEEGLIDGDAARRKRLELFNDSSLLENEPDFFDEHFCKYPVVRINFQCVSGTSELEFYRTLTQCIVDAAELLLPTLEATTEDTSDVREVNDLRDYIKHLTSSSFFMNGDLDSWCGASNALITQIFNTLWCVYRRRIIVLVDECDLPYISAMHQEWSDNAQNTYTKLLTVIFKNNPNLYKGFMVGIHLVDLCGADSGLNNLEHVSLVTIPPLNELLSQQSNSLSEYFGYTTDEVSILADKVMEASPGVKALGKTCILNMAKKWYDGYAIGGIPGRYNPFGTSHFFKKLCETKSVDMAAQPYWGKSARPSVIYKLAVNNHLAVGNLASRIMHEFDTGCQHPSIVVCRDTLLGTSAMRVRGFSNVSETSDMPTQEYIELTSSSYPDTIHGVIDMGQLVTCLLFGGYLTMDAQGGIRIPNGELRRQWEELRLASVF